MMNWVIIIGAGAGVSTVIGTALFLVLNLLRFNSNFAELRIEVKNLGKRMDETKTEMGKRMDEMKTEIEKRDAKIDKKFEEVDKKFEEVKGDIKDLRMEIAGRKMAESFDEMKTDIRYIKEGFEESENKFRKSRSQEAGKQAAKRTDQRDKRLFAGTGKSIGLEYLGREHIKGKSMMTA